jgi:hypothetical protein
MQASSLSKKHLGDESHPGVKEGNLGEILLGLQLRSFPPDASLAGRVPAAPQLGHYITSLGWQLGTRSSSPPLCIRHPIPQAPETSLACRRHHSLNSPKWPRSGPKGPRVKQEYRSGPLIMNK